MLSTMAYIPVASTTIVFLLLFAWRYASRPPRWIISSCDVPFFLAVFADQTAAGSHPTTTVLPTTRMAPPRLIGGPNQLSLTEMNRRLEITWAIRHQERVGTPPISALHRLLEEPTPRPESPTPPFNLLWKMKKMHRDTERSWRRKVNNDLCYHC